MNALQLEGTKDSPAVKMKPGSRQFSVAGRSFPEDSFSYYEKILGWINANPSEFSNGLTVSFFLTYVNSTSAIMLSRMLNRMRELAGTHEVKVLWRYYADDESMEELGHKLSETSGMPFQFDPTEEE